VRQAACARAVAAALMLDGGYAAALRPAVAPVLAALLLTQEDVALQVT
jgi:hypothetical protein